MSSKIGRIIGSRKDGLGARLLLTLNCIKVAQQFDVPFLIYWPTDDSLTDNMEHPEALFSAAMMDQHFIDQKTYAEIGKTALPLWHFLNDKTPRRLEKHLKAGGDILVEEGFEIVLFPWENDGEERAKYRGYFDRIGLLDVLQDRCERIDTVISQAVKGSIAYHLRRGDILETTPWMHTVWPSKIEPDEYYEIHLEKNPNATAIMFSDSPDAVTQLKQRFPHVMAIGDIVTLEGLDPLQRDFLELYAMSRVDEIIAPTLSAFSTAAARISGRQRLRFRDVLTDADFDAANARAVDRLLHRPESYASTSDLAHAYSCFAIHMADPAQFATATAVLRKAKEMGGTNAFLDIYLAVAAVHEEKWGDAAGHARNAATSPHVWPEDFASAKAIEAICYAQNGQPRKAGVTFREAFLFKPLRQDNVLAGTHLLLKKTLNRHNFLPFDHRLMRHLRLRKSEDRSSSYLVGKVINRRLRRDMRFIALDWHDLILDGKASRLRSDKAELKRMLNRLESLPADLLAENLAGYQSTKGLILAYLNDPDARTLLQAAVTAQPQTPLYIMRLANGLIKGGDLDGALHLLRQAWDLSPDNPFFAHQLGLTLAAANKKNKALEVLGTAAASPDATAKVQADFALAAYHAGERELAETAMRQAMEKIPVFGKFQNQLRRITK